MTTANNQVEGGRRLLAAEGSLSNAGFGGLRRLTMDIADRLHKEAMNVPIEIGALMQDAADQLMRLHVQLEIAYDRLRVAGYKIDGPTLSGIDAVLTPN